MFYFQTDENHETEDCLWKIRTDTLFKSHEVEFKLGERQTDTTMDGRSIAFIVDQDGPYKLVETQQSLDEQKTSTTIIREFHKDKMLVKLSVKDVHAFSVFTRVHYKKSQTKQRR